MTALKQTLRESFEKIIEALDSVPDDPPASSPASSPPVDDEESEFRARYEAERRDEEEAEFQSRLLAEKKQTRSKAERFLTEIRGWQQAMEARVDKIETTPAPEPAPPIIQQVVAPQSASRNWRLDVTARENGLMKTVLATADDERAVQFTITRTPDGYPKSIQAERSDGLVRPTAP